DGSSATASIRRADSRYLAGSEIAAPPGSLQRAAAYPPWIIVGPDRDGAARGRQRTPEAAGRAAVREVPATEDFQQRPRPAAQFYVRVAGPGRLHARLADPGGRRRTPCPIPSCTSRSAPRIPAAPGPSTALCSAGSPRPVAPSTG